MSEIPKIIPIQKVLELQKEGDKTANVLREQPEGPNIIPFERILVQQDQNDQEGVRRIREGIDRLNEGKKRYEEWKEIALEQGDTRSADLYELEATGIELLIIKGEMLCEEADMAQIDRWQKHFQREMEADRERESVENEEHIRLELEIVNDLIDSLSEEESGPEADRKLEKLLERKEKLENELPQGQGPE